MMHSFDAACSSVPEQAFKATDVSVTARVMG